MHCMRWSTVARTAGPGSRSAILSPAACSARTTAGPLPETDAVCACLRNRISFLPKAMGCAHGRRGGGTDWYGCGPAGRTIADRLRSMPFRSGES